MRTTTFSKGATFVPKGAERRTGRGIAPLVPSERRARQQPIAAAPRAQSLFRVLDALGDQSTAVVAAEDDLSPKSEIAVLAQIGCGDVRVAGCDEERQLFTGVELQGEGLDRVQLRRVDLGHDAIHRRGGSGILRSTRGRMTG